MNAPSGSATSGAASTSAGEPAIVFLGDDETDERAFEALRGKGMTVRVGSGPRRSAALRWVEDVRGVHRFLASLDAELTRSNGSAA